MTLSFETLVIGSGPAGIAAAVSAAENGVRVGLVDDNPSAGGQIWRVASARSGDLHHGNAGIWHQRLLNARVSLLQGWSVFDQVDRNTVRAERGEEVADLHFDHLVLATGARERYLPFPGWTLPNVMGVGAIQSMVKYGLPIQGKRIVLAGSGPLLLAVGAYLKTAGASVVCICEQASISQLLPFAISLANTPGKIVEGIRYRSATLGTPFYTSAWPVHADGNGQVRSVTLSMQGKTKTIVCDYLACAFHLVPNIELATLLGCAIHDGVVTVDEQQRTSVPNIYCAGEPTGIGGLELSLIEGQIAGLSIAGQQGKAQALFAQRDKFRRFASRLAQAFALRHELVDLPAEDTLLCRCEDVTYGAAKIHPSWRAAKLQTRCGMGPCQGRICGPASEFLLNWNVSSVRPPVLPARISSLVASRPDNETGLHTRNNH